MNLNASLELLIAEKGNTGQCQGYADLSFLEGKKVIRTGYIPEAREGGIVIDYEDNGVIKRAVFGCNDLGFWVEWRGEPGKESPSDVLRKKIEKAADVLMQKELTISSHPLKGKYAFIDEKGTPILTLSRGELKLMGEDVAWQFSSLPLNSERIFESIYAWVVNTS